MPEGIEVGVWEMPEQLCLIKTLLPKAEMTELTYMSVLVARCFDKLSEKNYLMKEEFIWARVLLWQKQ